MPPVAFTDFIHAARSGTHLVSFPTDTVPALAVRPDRSRLIFEAKQRSETKPLILMAASAADLWNYVSGTASELAAWQQIAERYWPGALTLVLPASDRLPPEVNPTDPSSVGVRIPNHPAALKILAQTGVLATTSVNRSGQPPLMTLSDINAQFPEVFTLLEAAVPAANQVVSGVPSTVVRWTGSAWKVLRQGAIEFNDQV